MTTASRAARVARAIHRACLVLAPAAVRRVYRDEMIATFAAAAEAAAAEGSAAVARLLAHELRDLLRARRVRRSGTRWSVAAEPPIYRPVLRAGWLHGSLWRQAWRSLTRRPAYLAAAVLTLGFGTGVMTAVFSLVDTVLIKPLPHPDADQLVERREHLQPAVLEHEIRIGDARRRERGHGDVERVDDVPVLTQRVGQAADDHQQHPGAEDRAELLLAAGVAERPHDAPEHHQCGQHFLGVSSAPTETGSSLPRRSAEGAKSGPVAQLVRAHA